MTQDTPVKHTSDAAPSNSQGDSTRTSSQGGPQSPGVDPDVWGSLIPFSAENVNVFRMNFAKMKRCYTIVKGEHEGVDVDFRLPDAAVIGESSVAHFPPPPV